jgi:hypothetical protein
MDLVLLVLLFIALLCVAGALWLSPLVWWILVIVAIIALVRLFMTRSRA